jgi:SlyX protein
MEEKIMSVEKMQQDIVDLQIKVAFQENMLQSLNQTIIDQNRMIDALTVKMKRWGTRLDEMMCSLDLGSELGGEPPPHY